MGTFGMKVRTKLFAILPIGMLLFVLVQPSPLLVSAQTGADAPLSHREVKKLIETRYNALRSLKDRGVLPEGSEQAPQRGR